MTVREHLYAVPTDAELDQMIGAATPHFALQIHDRVAAFRDRLPEDDPRREGLTARMAHLEALATEGEMGRVGQAELPARPSLVVGQGTGSGTVGAGGH